MVDFAQARNERDTERGTPLTDRVEVDNAYFSDWGYGPSGFVRADFARRLERDRTELMEALTGMCESLEHNEYPGGKKQCLYECRATLNRMKGES